MAFHLVMIDCNKGKMVDNGFRHTTFSCAKVNDKLSYEVIASCKFTEILTTQEHLDGMLKTPKAFLKSLEE